MSHDDCTCGGKCGDDCKCKSSSEKLAAHILDDEGPMIWSTCDESKERARSLYVIRAIVDRYRGKVEIDIEKNLLDINFPDDVSEEDQAECALMVEEELNKMGCDCE